MELISNIIYYLPIHAKTNEHIQLNIGQYYYTHANTDTNRLIYIVNYSRN